MKTNATFSVLLLSSLVLTSACTPRDVQVGDKDQRAKVTQLQTSRNSDFSLGNNALAAFMGEKQLEVIELIQLASDTTDSAKSSFNVESSLDKTTGIRNVLLFTANPLESLSYSNSAGTWLGKVDKKLSFELKEVDDLETLSAMISPPPEETDQAVVLKSAVDAADKKGFYVNLVEKKYNLAVAKDKDGNYLAVLDVVGDISGRKGSGKNIVNPITLTLTMTLEKDSLKTSEVQILKTSGAMTYPGGGTRIFDISMNGTDLVANMNGLCHSLVGKVDVAAGPKTRFSMTFDDAKVVSGKYTQTLAACGKRLTVDLSRFQVY